MMLIVLSTSERRISGETCPQERFDDDAPQEGELLGCPFAAAGVGAAAAGAAPAAAALPRLAAASAWFMTHTPDASKLPGKPFAVTQPAPSCAQAGVGASVSAAIPAAVMPPKMNAVNL